MVQRTVTDFNPSGSKQGKNILKSSEGLRDVILSLIISLNWETGEVHNGGENPQNNELQQK